MLRNNKGLSMMEYILGGALTLAILGLSVHGIATGVSAQGGNVVTSVSSMPAQPSW